MRLWTDKLLEVVRSVFPIAFLVLVVGLTVVPLNGHSFSAFPRYLADRRRHDRFSGRGRSGRDACRFPAGRGDHPSQPCLDRGRRGSAARVPGVSSGTGFAHPGRSGRVSDRGIAWKMGYRTCRFSGHCRLAGQRTATHSIWRTDLSCTDGIVYSDLHPVAVEFILLSCDRV